MSSFELNKIVGALLVAVLTLVVIGMIGDNLVTTGGGHGGGHGAEETVTAKAKTPKVKEPLQPILAMLASANVEAGQKVAKKCAACHDFAKDGKNKIGPALWNAVGAKRGSQDGFKYSKALLAKEGFWTYESLNAFLVKPKDYIPGTKMSFAGLKKTSDRANLIAYMRAAADTPAALPTQAEIDAVTKALEEAKQGAMKTVKKATEASKTAVAKVNQAPSVAPTPQINIVEMVGTADVNKGKRVFNKCKSCHTVDKLGRNGIGPNLWNVVNTKKASRESFKYSKALSAMANTAWTYENLNAFLLKPRVYAKGTKMTFAGLRKDSDRANVIAYLRTLADKPSPLK